MRRGEFKLIDVVAAIVELYNQGISAVEIGRRFGVSDVAVGRLLRHVGIPIRSRSEAMRITSSDPEWRENLASKLRDKPSGAKGKRWKYPERLEKPWIKGDKNPRWRGGITPLVRAIRTDARYAEWRLAVFQRDGFCCVSCGGHRSEGIVLNVDHVRPLAFLVRAHGVTNIEDARDCVALWDLSNGRTLCVDCHKRTDTFGLKAMTYAG